MTPTLQIDQPLTTDSAVVTLPSRLPPGQYRVTLSVVSASGISAPAVLTLIIR